MLGRVSLNFQSRANLLRYVELFDDNRMTNIFLLSRPDVNKHVVVVDGNSRLARLASWLDNNNNDHLLIIIY